MAYQFLLLASQAAGIGLSLYAQNKQKKLEALGTRADQAALDLRMQEEGAQTAEQSLFATEQLQEVLASQRAIFAARGTMAGAGSAGAISERSIRLYNADENARLLSKNSRELNLIGQKRGLELNRLSGQASRGANLMGKGLNMFNFNSALKGALSLNSSSLSGATTAGYKR